MAKIHRFIDNFDFSQNTLEIKGEIAQQMALVLKLKTGEKVELCDGKGISAMAEIANIGKKSVSVKIIESLESKNNDKNVTLFCAILKKENFELVVQKTTECGVSKIVPIITEHTVKTGLNLERLQKIAKEASEQSGRTTVPEISEPIKFTEAIKNLEGENIMFDASGELLFEMPWEARRRRTEKISSKKFLCISNNNSQYSIWIGPEGGWTPEEISLVKNLSFKIANLGPLTLRAETAALIATYLVSNF